MPPRPLHIDQITEYARCSMEWYWDSLPDSPQRQTPRDLLPALIKQASYLFYSSNKETVPQAVAQVIRDWFTEWGDSAMGDRVVDYILKRDAILQKFLSGKIKKSDGSAYVAPRFSSAYKSMMHEQGVTKLAQVLDNYAKGLGLILPEEYGVGSPFGDMFGDAMQIATKAEQRGDGWPARDVVLGLQRPYQIDLGPLGIVNGEADLIVSLSAEEASRFDGKAVAIEFHDFSERALRVGAAARSLPVIAAGLSRSDPGAEGVQWDSVAKVVYRHPASGTTFVFRNPSFGRLLSVVSAIVRGMRSSVIVPRMLTAPELCLPCKFLPLCQSDKGSGWEALDMMDPSANAQAQALLAVIRATREAMQHQPQVVQAAFQQIEDTMRDHAPDSWAMHTILISAQTTAQKRDGK